MAAIKIPERFKPGFQILAGLPESSYQAFLSAAKHAPATFANRKELELWVSSEVKSLPYAEVSQMIDSITSVYRLQSRFGASIQKLAAELNQGARLSIKNFKVADDGDFEARLTALLSLGAFNIVTVKAKELQTQSERIFCEARVLTDVRPIFGETVGEVTPAMIVVHTLKIVVHEGTVHKELYIALDSTDIASLIKTLERATEKSNALESLLKGNGLSVVDPSESE